MTAKKATDVKATDTETKDSKAVDLEAQAQDAQDKAVAEAKAKAELEAQAKATKQKANQILDKAEAKTKADTTNYTAQWKLHHANKQYKAGDTVALTATEAKPLLKAGAIALAQVNTNTEAKAD